MKKIIKLIYCIVFLVIQSLHSQTLFWTSPSFTNNEVRSGWFLLNNNPLEYRFYTFNILTSNLKIMDGPLSNTPLLDITLESMASEWFSNSPTYDYSGDGLNDIIIIRSYPPPNQRYGIRFIDVSNGQTLFTFDDNIYSYSYEHELPADVNGDGHTEIVIYRTDINFTDYTYLVYTTDGIPTSISNELNKLPDVLELNQNFPNPFNPSTTIRYSISSPEKILIKIYDISGQLIKEINEERNQPGEFEVIWDGTNIHKEKVSSGAYFYQVIAGNYSEAKKMILLK